MSTQQRWHVVRRVFNEILETPASVRAGVLQSRCGEDLALIREVESLLNSHDQMSRFLETPVMDAILEVEEKADDSMIGAELGSFRLVERIGAGGMGVVYRAIRVDGAFEQQVAVKVIRSGMESEETRRRFENERQVLADLEHPGIARLIDGGVTTGGRPFLVMEYVDGVPIHEYCHQARLNIDQRISLLRRVCEAVNRAHQSLIIHRDLKPGNILVTGDGTPKLLDFGIAKALDPESRRDETVLTLDGAFRMTPEYASPEQVRGRRLSTASDIYSLGVILYELLTGRRPYEWSSGGGVEEILNAVTEAPIRRPSEVVEPDSSSGWFAEVPRHQRNARSLPANTRQVQAAAARQETARSLKKRLRGDLDRIVLKSLQREIPRRYPSADLLADDLHRFQTGLPVRAQDDTWLYRAYRFSTRNRWSVTAAALLFSSVIVFAVVSGVLRRQAEAAAASEKQQRGIVESQKQELSDQNQALMRLADHIACERLLESEQTLWPAWPEFILDMYEWQERVAELESRSLLHQATLWQWRLQDSVEMAAGRQPEARQKVQEFVDLAKLVVDEPKPDPSRQRRLADLASRLPDFAWNFVADADLWRHRSLEALLNSIEALSGRRRSVQDRIELAEQVELFMDENEDRWYECIDSVADMDQCPRYQGLEIDIQMGLIPLGRNQSTGLWEFWHPETGSPPEWSGERGVLNVHDDMSIVFVLIPGGTFFMGAQKEDPEKPNYDPYAMGDEGPVIEVTLESYFLSKYELTQQQWRRLMPENSNPSLQGLFDDFGGPTHPVETVSWLECRKALQRAGLVLPTEAQWERAVRGGTQTPWWCAETFGELADIPFANLHDAKTHRRQPMFSMYGEPMPWEDDHIGHAPVGSFLPNPYGLFDMTGNVYEFCLDPYAPDHSKRDRTGWPTETYAGELMKTDRGGGFENRAAEARSARRNREPESGKFQSVGCRPARLLD